MLALTLVAWAGVRHSNRTRRGRALFVFTVGVVLIVLASAFFLLRAVGNTEFIGVGAAATLLGCAMLVVASGSLLPSVEDWFGARRELRVIQPLLDELSRRHPNVGIGIRPARAAAVPRRRADVADLRCALPRGHPCARRTTRHAAADAGQPGRCRARGAGAADRPVDSRGSARIGIGRRTGFPGRIGYVNRRVLGSRVDPCDRRPVSRTRQRRRCCGVLRLIASSASRTRERPGRANRPGAPGDAARRPSGPGPAAPRGTVRRCAPQYDGCPRHACRPATSAPCRASRSTRHR